MQHPRSTSNLISITIHLGAIALVLRVASMAPNLPRLETPVRFIPLITPYRPHALQPRDGGGGGGGRDPLPASKGNLVRFAARQFVPPTAVILNRNPRLIMEATLIGPPDIEVAKIDTALIGLPTGVAGPPSNGRGKNGGIGDGDGGGIGNNRGPGYGAGNDGGVTTDAFDARTSGPTTPPALLWKVEPEYSEDARKAKVQGTVVLYVEVDRTGKAQTIRVSKGLGLGLDESAVEAVRRWKFRPGIRNGKPVVSGALIEVNFRLL